MTTILPSSPGRPVHRAVLALALAATLRDFEDAGLHAAAHHAGAQAIVTRNTHDFSKATLPVTRRPS